MKKLLSIYSLTLGVSAGILTLVVAVAFGLLFEISMPSRSDDFRHAHSFWIRYVAGPLAVSTLLGVMFSRLSDGRDIALAQKTRAIIAAPFIAIFTFVAAYLVTTSFFSHYTVLVVDSILLLGYGAVISVVRWSVNLFCRKKRTA